ncbi:segregation/condensation protein A [Corynebacterium sp. sy017]|uniref:segregation and condensation protein A n=1 Tax=unclassified Corynebacterium TaxID=2624378 RepID=UPI001185B5E4|nr:MULTISPECIES: segregation/condensation protein A [unclassified Corynebacterium]MBP3087560.1 segregation/condensation protein A [Corynebacterium sp. sy017]TSD92138.1 segregation/condensation protein A [Corynebacterium sp. SY003]
MTISVDFPQDQLDHKEKDEAQETQKGFRIVLNNFQGPFDLLLQLISAKKLEITEIALSEVTDEFVAYTKKLGEHADLDEITEFLLIAATLLDLKAARLVPSGEVDSNEDLELLETRDLLFARLLQYKAYKSVADLFATWQEHAQRRYPRAVSVEEQFSSIIPPVEIKHTPASFAQLAASVFRPKPPETVATGHIHHVAVSVPEQAGKILDTLKIIGKNQWLSFDALTRDCQVSMHIVGRFLALLELYKAKAIDVGQEESLGQLNISWTGLEVDPAVVASSNWS